MAPCVIQANNTQARGRFARRATDARATLAVSLRSRDAANSLPKCACAVSPRFESKFRRCLWHEGHLTPIVDGLFDFERTADSKSAQRNGSSDAPLAAVPSGKSTTATFSARTAWM